MKNHEIEAHIIDALSLREELGLHTLKSLVFTEDKNRVEIIAKRMCDAGLIAEIKKHRYRKVQNNEHG